jgi:hypothetical protein
LFHFKKNVLKEQQNSLGSTSAAQNTGSNKPTTPVITKGSIPRLVSKTSNVVKSKENAPVVQATTSKNLSSHHASHQNVSTITPKNQRTLAKPAFGSSTKKDSLFTAASSSKLV